MHDSFNNSYTGVRQDLFKFLDGMYERVLDVGCATGANANYLKDEGLAVEVTGIEYDINMSEIARANNDYFFCGDLNNENFRKKIVDNSTYFDLIIFGDILEHLVDPWSVLKEFSQLLSSEGIVLISLPNIQHIELFIQVFIKGKWPLNPRGIFDKTHLRWFTYKNVLDLVELSGLRIKHYEPTYRSRDPMGSQFNWKYKILKKINPKWFVFQHKVICVREK